MAKETKDQLRAKRGFKKEAPQCQNCINYQRPRSYTKAVCGLDGFQIANSSYCNNYKEKPLSPLVG